MATRYTLHVNGEATDFTRSAKPKVIAEAERLITEKQANSVAVFTDNGTEVYSRVRKLKNILHPTKPYTKVIELPAELAELVPAGYVAVHQRKRDTAVLVRREDENAAGPALAVLDTTTAELIEVENQRLASQVMKQLGARNRETAEASA